MNAGSPKSRGHVDSESLKTTRLELRRPTQLDVDTIWRIHSDLRACAHNPSDLLTSIGQAEELYARWDQHWNLNGFGYWVLAPRTSHRPKPSIGFCGLKAMQLSDRDVLNLFYRLDPAAWGGGLATEAATAAVAWATEHVPDRPVIARVRPDNIASGRVAIRAGLRRAEHLDTWGEDGPDWIYATDVTDS